MLHLIIPFHNFKDKVATSKKTYFLLSRSSKAKDCEAKKRKISFNYLTKTSGFC